MKYYQIVDKYGKCISLQTNSIATVKSTENTIIMHAAITIIPTGGTVVKSTALCFLFDFVLVFINFWDNGVFYGEAVFLFIFRSLTEFTWCLLFICTWSKSKVILKFESLIIN